MKTYTLEKRDGHTRVKGNFKLISSGTKIKMKNGYWDIKDGEWHKYEIHSLRSNTLLTGLSIIKHVILWIFYSFIVGAIISSLVGGFGYFIENFWPTLDIGSIIAFIGMCLLYGGILYLYMYTKEKNEKSNKE